MAATGARVAAARRRRAWPRCASPFARWLSELGGGAEGASGARALALDARRTSPTTGLEEALARTLAERRATRDPGGADARRAPPRRPVDRRRAPSDLRRAGSQGEQRTAVLALLLAARDHLRARAARPILLLDDVLSELDPRRRRLLLEAVRDGGQTIVTSADPGCVRRAGGAP